MPISLTHNFTSPKTDGPDATLVQPSNWNEQHVLTQATSRLLGRTTAGTGPTEEISAGGGLSLASGTLAVDDTVVRTTGAQTIGGAKTFTDNINVGGGTAGQKQVSLQNSTRNTFFFLNTSNEVGLYDVTNTATRWLTDTSGNFTATGNVTAFSDRRLKADLEPIVDAVDKVKRLTGYTYTRIDTGERQTGVVAQEVQQVLPEAVIDNGQNLAVAYGNMVGLLIQAIKEQQIEIMILKGELASLKSRTDVIWDAVRD
jgi:hypothetical protein